MRAQINYVYQSAHVEIMRRRKERFKKMELAHTVLWWIPRGHQPTEGEAKTKLEQLRADGPSAAAFTFKNSFAAPAN